MSASTATDAAPRARDASAATILVTDADRGSALAIIRSLGRRGYRVVAADSDPRSLGFRSRYAAQRLLHPRPRDDPQGFLDAIERAVRTLGVDLIIPVTDEVIQLLSHGRGRIEELCRLALPEAEALSTVIDKRRTLDLARRLDVPVPRTRTATAPQEAAQAAADVGWPVVLKPAVSPRYEPTTARMLDWPVSFAADAGQIERALRRYEGCPELLVQEYCPGTGLGVEMLVREGRPLAAFQHRRLAEIPVCGGASAWRESVPLDQELYEWSRRLVGALRWTGLIMVEFKKGRETRLMEINGRVWGSLPLALASGMDFPARLAGLCLGESPAADGGPDTRYRLGVRAYNLELALLWIIQVLAGRRRYRFLPGPRRREALAAAAGLLGPSSRFDVACRDDPRPGFAEIGKIARKLARKVREAAAPRRRHRDG